MEGAGRRTPRVGEPVDRLDTFASILLLTRWVTVAVSVAIVAADSPVAPTTIFWGGIVVAYAAFRTVRPRGLTDDPQSMVAIVASGVIHVAAIVGTGYWESPLTFTLIAPVLAVGFARGIMAALAFSAATTMVITVPDLLLNDRAYDDRGVYPVMLLGLVALLGGYARRISGEASRRQLAAIDRQTRLAEANSLLFALHRAAQSLPASLDLDETVESTVTRLRDLISYELATLLLSDETDQGWAIARLDGPASRDVDLPTKVAADALPPPMARAVAGGFLVQVNDLGSSGGPGLWPAARSGLYIALKARGSVGGLIALEDRAPDHFDRRDVELLSGYVEPAALAIDNARWFGRLRTVGAEEERTRLARDLHDRIGQSLAHLAFELDRVVRARQRGDEIGTDLERLRDDVRRVVSEVRDTLSDLRTAVTERQDILAALRLLGERLRNRSGIDVTVTGDPTGRLPLPQERELFRIAQEAVVNVERHAEATTISIAWWSDGHNAILDITDDGQGFAVGDGRADSYGIVGMRERAASVGATLDIESPSGKGIRVRCVLGEDRARRGLLGLRKPG
ncbi:MAG: GAF domain-containing sensor histidine kinase [Acidimicrobiales bacterium]